MICGMLMLITFAFAFQACDYVGVEIGVGTDAYRENTDYLCSRPWSDEWYDDYGTYYYQELRFYGNNTGEDYLYTQDRHGYIQESMYNFTWDWFNSMYTSIRLTYGPGDYSYMDNISMGGNRLNCLLDGQPVYFIGK